MQDTSIRCRFLREEKTPTILFSSGYSSYHQILLPKKSTFPCLHVEHTKVVIDLSKSLPSIHINTITTQVTNAISSSRISQPHNLEHYVYLCLCVLDLLTILVHSPAKLVNQLQDRHGTQRSIGRLGSPKEVDSISYVDPVRKIIIIIRQGVKSAEPPQTIKPAYFLTFLYSLDLIRYIIKRIWKMKRVRGGKK